MSDPAGVEGESSGEPPPEVMARRLGDALVAALGDEVVGIVGHGSWVHGDFCPGRSDLDLVVVLRHDPDPALLAVAGPVLDDVTGHAPAWRHRLEIGFASRAAVDAVLAGQDGHVVGRVSGGEALQLVPADRHRLLDWDAAHRGRAVHGPPAAEILPAVPPDLVREVVTGHLRQWPTWLAESSATGFRAYAVLTVSRAAAYLETGEHRSKRAAATWAGSRFPEHRAVLRWATQWWYGGGRDDETAPAEVDDFVPAVVRSLIG